MRLHTVTQKVSTQYGSHYVAVSRDAGGNVVEISISSPGKFDNSELNNFIVQLNDAFNELLAQQ